MKMIEFKNVEKYFKKRKIIKNLSFSINKNEVIGLIGTNGAGKTTTIRMILGLIKPDSGEIIYGSKNKKPEIGVQLQTTPFFEGFTVEENLKLFGTFQNLDMTKENIQTTLENYTLFQEKKTLASKLSLGQQKRLALCIATLHDPELVILDEPSAGLDPGGQRDIQKMVLKLKNKGTTILFSSHDMLEVRNIADRIMIMDKGVLSEEGSPEELIIKYNVKNLEEVFYKSIGKENDFV